MPTTKVPAATNKEAIIGEIERLGFQWEEVAQYDLSQTSPDRRVQVRESKHYAPKSAVAEFAVQMEHVEFPPVVMTKDDWVVDGNTRIDASRLRGQKFFPAIVLNETWEGATAKRKNEMRALAATFNAKGGTRLTPAEIRAIVPTFIELGWRQEQIGRAIGVKPQSVAQVKRELDAVKKLERVGLDGNGSVKGASLRALGSREALNLNDVPYKTLASLAADAGLNAGEIVSLAKEAKETGSDTAAVDQLEQARTEMEGRIRERELTGRSAPPAARRLRQHLGFVVNYTDHERDLVEFQPQVAQQHVETLEHTITVLNRVLEAQRAVLESA